MSLLWKILDGFWKITEKNDAKTHSTQTEPEGITKICDIPYIDDGDHYHLFDVYYPENHEGSLPVIIDIHGGGWMYADKDLNRFYNLELASRGFTVFSISYRLAPSVTPLQQLADCMTALKFIREHMDEYPCDSSDIMLTGDSAGGMLAGFCSCLLESEDLRHVFKTVNPDMHLSCLLLTSPVAYMDCDGPIGLYTKLMWGSDRKTAAGDFMNISSMLPFTKLPPTLLLTSSGDFLAETQTLRLAADLKKHHIPCKIVDYPVFDGRNLPHVFSVLRPASDEGKNALDIIEKYYRKVISLK